MKKMSEKKESTATDKKISRRSMLKWTGGLAGAAVVGALAEYGASALMKPQAPPPPPPVSFKPPLSPDVQQRVDTMKQQLIALHQGEDIYYTCCSQNGCRGGNCILKVRVKNGVMTAIETDDLINPGNVREDVSEDDLNKQAIQQRACAMGRGWRQEFYDPRRIIYPMKNVATGADRRGNAKLVRITWQEALDTVANWMKEVKEKWGPYTYEDNTAVRRGSSAPSNMHFFYDMGVSGHGQMSSQGWLTALWFHTGLTQGSGMVGVRNPNIFDAKAVVFWGRNISSWHAGQCPYYHRLAHEKGIPFIIIDPRYTYESEIFADQWIPIRPQTDVPLLIAIMNVLFKEDLYDHDFVAQQVEPTGFQKWKDYVLGNAAAIPPLKETYGIQDDESVTTVDGAIDRTPEWAEKITGVPAETTRALARFLAQNKGHIDFEFGLGFQRREYGEDGPSAAILLESMLGNLNNPGNYGLNAGQGGAPGGPDPSITSYYKRKPYTYVVPNTFDCRDNVSRAILLRPLYEEGKLSAEEYNHLMGGLYNDPIINIKMMFYARGFMTPAALNQTIRSFKILPYLIWTLGQYKTNVVYNYVDMILPTPNNFFETQNFETSGGDGQDFFVWHPVISQPPGEVRNIEYIKTQLGDRLGVSDRYNPTMSGVPWEQWEAKMDEAHQQAYEKWATNDLIKPLSPPSWADFKKAPVFRKTELATSKKPYPLALASYVSKATWPATYKDGKPGSGVIINQGGGGTKSGKIEFVNEFLSNREAAKKECWEGATAPAPYWEIAPDDFWSPLTKRYPLYAQVGFHSLYRQHSTHDQNDILNDEYRHACHISVADAKARGIKDGDIVRVYSNWGEMILPAYVTARITPGNINVSWGAYYKPSSVKTALNPEGIDTRGCANILTSDVYTRGNNTYGRVLVQVEKFSDADAQHFGS
jgi:anaerobic dimethyl sulfoxide reductase subunit A